MDYFCVFPHASRDHHGKQMPLILKKYCVAKKKQLHGQLCTLIAVKWVFLTNVVIFELGSLFCGVAPSMNFLIFGRAFQGVGGAGLFVSSLAIMGEVGRSFDTM